MFSLIITIISIALVAALALATLYYGGDAFNQGRAGAEASRLINEGQQVNAAVTLNTATGGAATSLTTLVSEGVLSQAPAGLTTDAATAGNLAGATAAITSAAVADEVCAEVQTRAGAAALALVDAAAAGTSTQMYGCYGTAGAQTFFFKL